MPSPGQALQWLLLLLPALDGLSPEHLSCWGQGTPPREKLAVSSLSSRGVSVAHAHNSYLEQGRDGEIFDILSTKFIFPWIFLVEVMVCSVATLLQM